jgi:hypothetical protein
MVYFRKFKVWFCLIVYFMALGTAQGAVLCIGPNGHVHVKIKLVEKAGCDQTLSSSPQPDSCRSSGAWTLFRAKDQCAPCVDIPLVISEHQPVSAQLTVFLDLPLSGASASDTMPTFSGLTAKAGASIIFHTGNPALASLRTIVLLI